MANAWQDAITQIAHDYTQFRVAALGAPSKAVTVNPETGLAVQDGQPASVKSATFHGIPLLYLAGGVLALGVVGYMVLRK